jgi:uncharacterized membrane protein
MLQTQAWYGGLLIGLGLLFVLFAALTAGLGAGLVYVAALSLVAVGVLWLLIGAVWLRAVTRARQVVRDGHWPERPGP